MTDPLIVKRVVKSCRVCDNPSLFRYLDLGDQPLANALLTHADLKTTEPRVPLIVLACVQCGLSQLAHVVEPSAMFNERYAYHSGVSPQWHAHCDDLVDELVADRDFLIDIGSNDGTLLEKAWRKGATVLGIDPAGSGAQPFLTEPWSLELAQATSIKADVIVAQNVLGHVDDVHDFVAGLQHALRADGVVVIEVPYLPYLLAHTAFDTVYHEHVSYWTLKALGTLLLAHGLRIRSTRFLPQVHGGSIRVYAEHGLAHRADVTDSMHVTDPQTYEHFADAVSAKLDIIDRELGAARFDGFSAPAKATVLLNCIDARPHMIYDDTPAKWDRWVPGVRVPIERPFAFEPIERLCLFAWNWAEPLKTRARALGFRGEFFVPLPTPHWTR